MKDITLRVMHKMFNEMGLPPCKTLEEARCLLFRQLAKDDDDEEFDLNSLEIDGLLRKCLRECKRED